jgi:hypothetical protein
MGLKTSKRVHIAPLGFEYDRIIEPVIEYQADQLVLIQYVPSALRSELEHEAIEAALAEHGVDCEFVDTNINDLFDCVATYGSVFDKYSEDELFINLSSGNKITAIGGMIASMVSNGVHPYYVEAEEHGSHQPPAPEGVASIDSLPSHFIEKPDLEQLVVMDYIASSDRTNRDGEPYRIKRELFEFGEQEELPFMSEYEGDTTKGKFRRLGAHIISPLQNKDYLSVVEVGTQKRVFLTDKGWNTIRAFRYLLD